MKFSKSVVLMAWAVFAVSAVAQGDATTKPATTINVNVSSADATAAPAAAPAAATVAAPAAAAATDANTTDSLRKVREAEEKKNDTKVVEKLEKTRLDDEKQLSQKIETTDLKTPAAPAAAPVAPTVTIEKVEVVQPAPAAPAVTAAPAVVAAPAAPAAEEKKEDDRKWYAGIGTGNVFYNGNILTKADFAVVAGTKMDDKLVVEGSLTYTSFTLNNYWGGVINNGLFGTMDQYDIGATAKYLVVDNQRFRPYVGGGVDYIYRQYKDRIPYTSYWSYDNYTSQQTTNAFNASLVGGVDVAIGSRLLLGAEFKYSLPVYHQDNGLITASYVEQNAKPLEEQSFTSWLISLKFLF